METYEYDDTDIDVLDLALEIEAQFPSENFVVRKIKDGQNKCRVEFQNSITQSQLDTVVTSHKTGYPIAALEKAKILKKADIDRRTEELINDGFTYNSQEFSGSPAAQINGLGSQVESDKGNVTYPLKITRKDDYEESLADAAAVDSYVLIGFGTIKAHRDSGRALKIQINDATTQAELDSVVDNR